MADNQSKQSQKERLKEITESIETGIKEMFASDKYRTYLQTMSRFHKYSLNNTMLIAMQKPDATLVAGFNKWKNGFSRNVKKGEKGIKIIAPVPYKIKEEREMLDPQTKAPLLDGNGKAIIEEVERQIPTFKVVSVFDVSQTEGKELPTLVNDLAGNVEHYDVFMEALKRTSPVPIQIKPIATGADGYYHLEDKSISIRYGMSEVQTISATIHEIAHSKLHDYELQRQAQSGDTEITKKDRNTEEVEAESISYAVCNYYGIETSDNSFGYIANWSKDKELKELKSSLELIEKTSSELISGIDKHFAEIVKERGIDLTQPVEQQIKQDPLEKLATDIDAFTSEFDPHEYADQVESSEVHILEIKNNIEVGNLSKMREYLKDIADDTGEYSAQASGLLDEISKYEFENYPKELAYMIDDNYLSIFEIEDGYEYSIYDSEYNLLDGGVYDDPSITIFEATFEVAEIEAKTFPFEALDGVENVDFTELVEKSEAIKSAKIKAIKFEQMETENTTEHTAQLPDPTISKEEMSQYGYTSDELLPLSRERALELFKEDFAIYALHTDNSESMLFEIEELDEHNGYFGIEKIDWENFLDFKMITSRKEGLSELEEKAFLENTADSFAIYQVKSGSMYRDYHFTSVKELESMERSIERANYVLVYTDNLQNTTDVNGTLNSLYHDFNVDKPEDYKGRSMSVSDIVAIKMNSDVSYHYVDSFGFKEVPNFNEPAPLVPDNYKTGERIDTPRGSFSLVDMTREQMEKAGYGFHHSSDCRHYDIMGNGTRAFAIMNELNPLKNAEMSVEQNYNQIDGIINNEPIVGKIEYLSNNGNVAETIEYTDKQRFEEQVKEDNYYGVPISVTVYSADSRLSEHLDPPPQGYKVESEGRKSVLDELKATKPLEGTKEKTHQSRNVEKER